MSCSHCSNLCWLRSHLSTAFSPPFYQSLLFFFHNLPQMLLFNPLLLPNLQPFFLSFFLSTSTLLGHCLLLICTWWVEPRSALQHVHFGRALPSLSLHAGTCRTPDGHLLHETRITLLLFVQPNLISLQSFMAVTHFNHRGWSLWWSLQVFISKLAHYWSPLLFHLFIFFPIGPLTNITLDLELSVLD